MRVDVNLMEEYVTQDKKRTIIGVSVIHSKAHKTSRVKKDYIWNSITCSCECDKDYDIDE